MCPALQNAVEGVYDAFRDVKKPSKVEGCPCCLDSKNIFILLAKPLRELTPEDLSSYASSVFLTVGEIEDFLYFLPRILEILASNPDWWPDPELVTRAIDTSAFHTWPNFRRQSVLRYLDEVINDLLATEYSGGMLDSWICAIGRLHIDLSPYLARIVNNWARLIEFYELNNEALMEGQLFNSFWDDCPEEGKQLVEWFRSAETQKAILKHYREA